jgi:type III pantothenate kinase
MLLAIDIGNTNTSLGIFDGENLIEHWRIATACERTSDELGVLIRQILALSNFDYQKISALSASSVVPQLNFTFQKMSEKYLGQTATFVDATFDFGLEIKYNPPSSIGIDRIVAAVGAIEKYGKPCIVCDFGTATTIDAVNSQSEFLGGIITAGINLLADALFQNTSKLPKVAIKKPKSIIGNSTVHSIQAGIYFGYIGLVDGIIEKMIDELGEKPKVVATGGFAKLIAESSKKIDIIDETLMLEGLRLIYEKQARSKMDNEIY